jgi:hypothetical protein
VYFIHVVLFDKACVVNELRSNSIVLTRILFQAKLRSIAVGVEPAPPSTGPWLVDSC